MVEWFLSKYRDDIELLGGYLLVDKSWSMIVRCLEMLRILMLASVEGYCMYTHYNTLAPSLHKDSTNFLVIVVVHCNSNHHYQ